MNKYFKKIKRWWNRRKYHQDLPPYRKEEPKYNVVNKPYKKCHNLDDVMKMFNEFVESVDKSQGAKKK